MTLSLAIAGLVIWTSYEFLLRGPGEARAWAGGADEGRSSTLLIASFLLAIGITIGFSLLGVGPVPNLLKWAGCVVLSCGLCLRAWSMLVLGSSYRRRLAVTDQQSVIMSGPYRLIRHPGYAGSLLVWIGFGVAAGTWFSAVLVAVVVGTAYLLRIRSEERMLRSAFGTSYATYQRKTRRLIPGVF